MPRTWQEWLGFISLKLLAVVILVGASGPWRWAAAAVLVAPQAPSAVTPVSRGCG
jgi:hypothetical protein